MTTDTEKKAETVKAHDMFVTPLMGQFLNLPRDAAVIECPACGVKELSLVKDDNQWWADELNTAFGCLFLCLCCCCCLNYYKYRHPIQKNDRSHYCKNCGCFFGRSMEHRQIKISKPK